MKGRHGKCHGFQSTLELPSLSVDSKALLVGLASDVLAGTVAAAQLAERLLPFTKETGAAAELLHFLHHYAADGDIRERSPTYASAQVERLRSLMDAVQAGR